MLMMDDQHHYELVTDPRDVLGHGFPCEIIYSKSTGATINTIKLAVNLNVNKLRL